MIKITYPGTNNFSSFVYDGLGRNVSIVETTAGSVTSTKQFVRSGADRKEERDGSGTLTKKFFDRGQMNGTSKYFYDADQLGSVREMTDNSGGLQAQYAYAPYGQVTRISETVASDFGYADYYAHTRSGLNLTLTRAYSSTMARFNKRDSIEEQGGLNLYAYVNNAPIQKTDPLGLDFGGGLVTQFMRVPTGSIDPFLGPSGGSSYVRGPKAAPDEWEPFLDPATIPTGNLKEYRCCIDDVFHRANEKFGTDESDARTRFINAEIEKCKQKAGAKGNGFQRRGNPNERWDEDTQTIRKIVDA